MKQAEIVKNKPYKLVWMQCRDKPELNGAVVEVVKKISGTMKTEKDRQLGNTYQRKSPVRYLLNIGIKVNAANLQEIRGTP